MQEPFEWRIRAEGRVQKVGFRAAVKFMAERHSITGFVRNCSDGSVEICAQGTELQLEVFTKDLSGNQIGRGLINRIDIQKVGLIKKYSSFSIM